jgi:hypothetical protein
MFLIIVVLEKERGHNRNNPYYSLISGKLWMCLLFVGFQTLTLGLHVRHKC